MVSGGMLKKHHYQCAGNPTSMLDAMGKPACQIDGRGVRGRLHAAAGVDVEAIQRSYLWKAGLKMWWEWP